MRMNKVHESEKRLLEAHGLATTPAQTSLTEENLDYLATHLAFHEKDPNYMKALYRRRVINKITKATAKGPLPKGKFSMRA